MQLRPIPRNLKKKFRTLVRCTDSFPGNGLQVQFVGSVLAAVQYQQAGHDWPIVVRKYVFSRRKAEKLHSAVADVAGTTSSNVYL